MTINNSRLVKHATKTVVFFLKKNPQEHGGEMVKGMYWCSWI